MTSPAPPRSRGDPLKHLEHPDEQFNQAQQDAIRKAATLAALGMPAALFVAQHVFAVCAEQRAVTGTHSSVPTHIIVIRISSRAAFEWGWCAPWVLESMGLCTWRDVLTMVESLCACGLFADDRKDANVSAMSLMPPASLLETTRTLALVGIAQAPV